MDVVVLLDAAGTARHTVGIEHEDEDALFEALIVAENVHQPVAGGVEALLGKGVQLVPRKDDVVAIHQQVFGGDLPLLGGEIGPLPLLHRAERRQRVAFDGAVGALKNFQQFGVLFQRSAVSRHPAGTGRGLFCCRGGVAPAAVHVHMAAHLLPRHHKARTVGAEHRVSGVVQVVFRLIVHCLDDLRRVVAGAVAVQRQVQVSPAPGVADHLHGVAAHSGHRCKTGKGGRLAVRCRLGRVKAALHPLDVAHGAANVLRRHFQPEGIPRLEQLGLFDLVCHHKALPHGAVGGLPEVAALGMFEMGAACDEGDLHIRQRCADEDAEVLLFFQMGQHEALPVFVQLFLPAVGGKLHPAASGQRLELQMHLGIVAQRLIMAHTLDGLGDRFLI